MGRDQETRKGLMRWWKEASRRWGVGNNTSDRKTKAETLGWELQVRWGGRGMQEAGRKDF